jgi:hypothetical protein
MLNSSAPIEQDGVISMSEELKKLSDDYCLGQYRDLEKDLEEFIRKNKESIRKFKETELKHLDVVTSTNELAIKLYILKTRTINPATEIRTELAEIEKEIWIQGEKISGTPDRNKIATEWCKLHAPGWRDKWVFAALYVFEHNKDHYIRLLD